MIKFVDGFDKKETQVKKIENKSIKIYLIV